MIFNKHLELEGKHAFLSPSVHSWLNYDSVKLETRYHTVMAARRGSDLHALAHEAVRLGVKLAKTNMSLATYVNDAIGYKMICEQVLYYSPNCFGTADSISFRRGVLRIHDLKTGTTPVSQKQLEIYAALFCLEYGVDPFSIEFDLRIYQGANIFKYETPPELIASIMEKIVDFDKQIEMFSN